MSVGKRLKILREERGLSQVDVADALGISHASVSTYELDTRQIPIDKLVSLADLYRANIDYILGLDERKMIDVTDLDEITYERILEIIEEYDIMLKHQR